MPTALNQALRSRLFALCIHVGLWLLLFLALTNLGGKVPNYRDATSYSLPAQSAAPVSRLSTLFSPDQWPKPIPGTNTLDPFFTRYFVPPPKPAPAPPTTRRIEITYLGFYQAGDGPTNAMLKVAESFVAVRVGAPVATNLFVSQASMQTLTLTNLAAQTNLLSLNTKKEIEVPIR